MARLLAAVALLAPATGFVAPAAPASSSALRADASGMDGIQAPTGFFDPLGLSKSASDETLAWYRAAEIKHGRVAMAAFVGYCVQANGGHWATKMTLGGADWPSGSPPEQWDALPAASKWQIILFVGMLELFDESVAPHYMMGRKPGMFPSFSDAYAEGEGYPHPVPFDLFDPFGSLRKMMDTEEKRARGRLVEINNGRAAMLGIFGFMSASKVPGSVPVLTFIPPYDGNYMIPFEGNFHMPSMM